MNDKELAENGVLRTANAGRRGIRWTKLRNVVLSASTVCGICGHDGADAVDHIFSRYERPDLAEDPTNLQPAHGVNRCPTCDRACNSEKGARKGSTPAPGDALLTSEDWFDAGLFQNSDGAYVNVS